MRWFVHLEHMSVDDWVSGRNVEMAEVKCRPARGWEDLERMCVKIDVKLLGLLPEGALFRNMWRDIIYSRPLPFQPMISLNSS